MRVYPTGGRQPLSDISVRGLKTSIYIPNLAFRSSSIYFTHAARAWIIIHVIYVEQEVFDKFNNGFFPVSLFHGKKFNIFVRSY